MVSQFVWSVVQGALGTSCLGQDVMSGVDTERAGIVLILARDARPDVETGQTDCGSEFLRRPLCTSILLLYALCSAGRLGFRQGFELVTNKDYRVTLKMALGHGQGISHGPDRIYYEP